MSNTVEQPTRVSVIIPTYNRGEYLREALASVFAQTFPPFEILIIDDGSTDDTPAIVRSFEPKVRYHRHARNSGVSVARNTGLATAHGDVIAWLDSDDLWEPDFLATVVPLLTQDETLAGVYTGITVIDADGTELSTSVRVEPPEKLSEALEQGCFILTSSFTARKSCYDQVGGFDPRFRIAEDADMFLRMSREFRIVGLPRPLVRYRVHTTNTVSNVEVFREARLRYARKRIAELNGDASDLSAATNAAYGRAYRSIALKYILNGQQEEGWLYMSKSAAVYPEILGQPDTFYELACGDQPPGLRGDAKLLDIEHNGAEMLHHLDLLFADGSPGVQVMRGVAFGNAYLALGMLSDQANRWSEAQNYLLRALRENPKLVAAPGMLRRLLKVTFLTPGFAATVKSRRQES